MATFDEIVDKKLRKEDIKNTQFMFLIKYRDDYNNPEKAEVKKKNLRNFRKLYEKIKDSLTPDEDKELVKSLSGEMLEIYYEDISEPDRVEPEPEPEPDEESNQELRHLRVSRHIETLGKAREKIKKSRKKKRKKSRKKKSKKRRRSKK